MELIDKDALVAEIERRIKERDIQMKMGCWVSSTYIYEDLLDFLDTLEVKEVDLEKEIKNAINEYYNECEKKLQEMNDNDTDISFLQLDKFAKHFFELGIKSKGE